MNLSQWVGDDPAAVAENRRIVLRAIGGTGLRGDDPPRLRPFEGPTELAWMRQVHGADVVRAEPGGFPAANPPADAIFTASTRIALAVNAADCAPVLLADPVARLVGAAHAGRPGLAAGVVPALLAAMVAAGADPSRVRAVVGPSICGRCYEVPASMRDDVARVVPASACVTSKGTPGIDLRAGLHAQLAGAGVVAIADDLRCTAESAELYSYRRDGATGRFAGLIWLTP